MPKAHRNNDSRVCGAKTTVQNQSTVFVNGELWAVDNSFNNHGQGGLIHSGTTVFVEGKNVIVHAADNSRPDNLCPQGAPHCNPATAQGSDDVYGYDKGSA